MLVVVTVVFELQRQRIPWCSPFHAAKDSTWAPEKTAKVCLAAIVDVAAGPDLETIADKGQRILDIAAVCRPCQWEGASTRLA